MEDTEKESCSPVKEVQGAKMSKEAKCEALEKSHVHDVYASTAHHFARVRYKAWPRVRKFIMELEPGSLVADVGCGNGRYLHVNESVYKLGSDRCTELVHIANEAGHEVMSCDNLRLPYRDGCFDAVISIGVIHHLTTPKRRATAVTELARILRPGGKLMMYVWAMEQKHRNFDGQDVLVPWHFQPKPPRNRKERDPNGVRRKELSSVSSFSEDEGVSEPCLAATEYSLQEEQNDCSHFPHNHQQHCSHNSHTTSCPIFLEAGIDPKCLQRNLSLPSPVRRTSLTIAERSLSWDHSCHTSALLPPTALTALQATKCPLAGFNAAHIPLSAKLTTPPLPQQQGTRSQSSGAGDFSGMQQVSEPTPAESSNVPLAKTNPEFTAAGSSFQNPHHCSCCADHAAKTDVHNCQPQEESKSISAAIKSKVLGFFQRSFSPLRNPEPSEGHSSANLSRRSKVKDEEYRKLVEYIMREEAELLHCERPALEHTVSAPESSEVFAVREFPMSSQVLTRRKSRSLDEPPVIAPRVRRKSKSLDEPPRIERMDEESNESAEEESPSHAVLAKTPFFREDNNHSLPLVTEKFAEAEQSCDSGNQSDSGTQDIVSTENANISDLAAILHVRNDSGTVVEDKDESDDECEGSSTTESDIENSECVDIEDLEPESVVVEEKASTSAQKSNGTVSEHKVSNIISDIVLPPERAARRSSLQFGHKKVSPAASNGSCSDKSSVETDCDEWARTTEAVIRSMQNQMLRRQSAIEDFGIDFDRFTTSSSGDSRLTAEDLNNGASPPNPIRRGSEASTISSDGGSIAESPSEEESDVWKSKSNSPDVASPEKEFALPCRSALETAKGSSGDSSSSNVSSPVDQPAYHRFYHVFREGELVDLIERHVDNLHVISCYYDHANWCVVAEKVQVWRI